MIKKVNRINELIVIEYLNGDKHWYLNGKLHRIDGPAVEYTNGDKEYWILGIRIK